jgi:TPR repeat protein
LLLALAAMTTQVAVAAPAHEVYITPEQKFQMALEAQTEREYRTMMALLRQAAEAGNLEAQEMLGMALLTGPTLYGNAVKSDRCEAGTWIRRAAAQGSEIGKHQLAFLSRLRQAPAGKDICQALGK